MGWGAELTTEKPLLAADVVEGEADAKGSAGFTEGSGKSNSGDLFCDAFCCWNASMPGTAGIRRAFAGTEISGTLIERGGT